MRRAPDPLARRSPALVRLVAPILTRHVRHSFHALRVARPGPPALPTGRPVLIYCNHPAWWDPAVLAVLATRLFPDRISAGPIDADALARYGLLGRVGLFPIRPGTAGGAAAFLRAGTALLARSDTLLWVTAEGRFSDPRHRPLALRPGVAALLRRHPHALAVPLALEYPFWTERLPEALVRFGDPVDTAAAGAAEDPRLLSTRLAAGLAATMDRLAGDAIAKDPAAFDVLLAGRVGVGGVYDVWRRVRAWAAGRRFSAAHGPERAVPGRPPVPPGRRAGEAP